MYKKVIIVDSGIDYEQIQSVAGISLCDEREDDYGDELGHGTAIYSIIAKHVEPHEIYIVKISNTLTGISEEIIIKALRYIIENFKPCLINLSLGSGIPSCGAELQKVCNELFEKGFLLISSFDNKGSMAFPAAYGNVIGVTSSDLCRRYNDFIYIGYDAVNVAANGGLQRVCWKDKRTVFAAGDSYACAHVTSAICHHFKEKVPSFDDALKYIKQIAKKSIEPYKRKPLPKYKSIKAAALYPFGKEMSSLLKYQELLSFEIKDVYTHHDSLIRGINVSNIVTNYSHNPQIIKSIRSIIWDNIDTLILGYHTKLNELINHHNIDIVSDALEHNVQVFSFDDIRKIYSDERVFCPVVEKDNMPPYNMGKLYCISKPVVGIFGTSSAQGKYTLQLELRKRFLADRYDVGQIGTEPSATLFGMDYAFPMGYNSSVYINGTDTVRYVNSIIHELCLMGKEIIIVGGQSGTLTFDHNNLAQYNIEQYSFLLGTSPDCVILCVNPYDPLDYIQNTINFIELSCNTTVIALAVFPIDLKKWEMNGFVRTPLTNCKFDSFKSELESITSAKVLNLGIDSDVDKIYSLVLDFFSV